MKIQMGKGLILLKGNKKDYPKESFKSILRNEIKQFCLSTNLHGYKFIALPRRKRLERFFWVSICFVTIAITLGLIAFSYKTFDGNPLILVTDSPHFEIWNYEFPAITICENNKISSIRAVKVAKYILNTNDSSAVEDLIKELRYMYYLIRSRIPDSNLIQNFTYLQNIFDERGFSAHQVLKLLANRCDALIIKCIWKGLPRKCTTLFKRVKTSEGYCCSFNSHVLKNNVNTSIFTNELTKIAERVSSCGYQTGLIVLLNNFNDMYASYIPSFGHRVRIHNTYNFPDWNSANTFNPPGVLNLISISPVLSASSEEVRKIPIATRECLFPDERNLIYFKFYSFHNCLAEIRMNLSILLCNCTPYFYIDETVVQPGLKICNMLDIPCLAKIEKQIKTGIPGENSSLIHIDNSHLTSRRSCFRDCDATFYRARSHTTKLSRQNTNYLPYLFGGVEIKNHSVLRIFFGNINGIKNKRHIRFTWDSLLALYGGLLGLFLGFSVVSGFDIVYFCIRSLGNHIAKNKIRNQSTTILIQNQKNITAGTNLDKKAPAPFIKRIRKRNLPILPYID